MSSSRHRLGEVRTSEDGRLTLRFERWFAHPPGKVWRAITEAAHLQAWGFPADIEFDLTPGARLLFRPTAEQRRRFGMTADQVTEGRMISAEPPRLLEYTWARKSCASSSHRPGTAAAR